MKNIVKIIALLTLLNCKAQIISPIYKDENTPAVGIIPDRYYKDVDGDFNPYVGTWSGYLGNKHLEITFNKMTHFDNGDGDYFDFLVGELIYKENGVEILNTYPELAINDPNGVLIIADPEVDNTIVSADITTMQSPLLPPCSECSPNTRFIKLDINDPSAEYLWGVIHMVRFVENGVEKIRIRANNSYTMTSQSMTIPENSIWTLVKVE